MVVVSPKPHGAAIRTPSAPSGASNEQALQRNSSTHPASSTPTSTVQLVSSTNEAIASLPAACQDAGTTDNPERMWHKHGAGAKSVLRCLRPSRPLLPIVVFIAVIATKHAVGVIPPPVRVVAIIRALVRVAGVPASRREAGAELPARQA